MNGNVAIILVQKSLARVRALLIAAHERRIAFYIAAAATIAWFGLVLTYSDLGLWGALRSSLWNGTLFAALLFYSRSLAAEISNDMTNPKTQALAHCAAAFCIATGWMLASMATGAALTDWYLEGPLEEIAFFDWLESLFDNTEAYFPSDPGWLAYRWTLGLLIYFLGVFLFCADAASTKAESLEKRVQLLLQEHGKNEIEPDETCFFIRDQGRLLKLSKDTIDLLEGERDYVRVHTPAQQYLIRFPLKKFEEELDNDRFVRVHRSRIVNIGCIEAVDPLGDGRAALRLKNGLCIHTSRQGGKLIRKKLSGAPISNQA